MSTPTVSPEYVWRWQCDPVFNDAGTLTNTPLVVFYRKDLDLGDGSPLTSIESSPSLTVDLAGNAAKTVVMGGKTYSYGELVAALAAVVAQERAAPVTPA